MATKTRIWFVQSLVLLLINFDKLILTNPLYESIQLYEGSRCLLETGAGEGICVKAVNCPEKMQQIRSGNYNQAGRCGFSNFDEIVCCGLSRSAKSSIRNRPADAACERWKRLPQRDSRTLLLNGVRASVGEFPYMAGLGYVAPEAAVTDGIKYLCGGTLISEKHVLTAAHCVSNIQDLVPIEVILGSINPSNPYQQKQRISILRITKHPQYKLSLNYHDVAVLELQDVVNITNLVQPTCLMTKPSANADPYLTILGWGAVDLEGTLSTVLMKAEGLKFVDKTECSESYKHVRAQIPTGLDDGMVCVRDPDVNRNADTCWGDSGGPLLIASTSPPQLAGVTSFGQACGGRTPAIYASVYEYLDWIEEQVWPISD